MVRRKQASIAAYLVSAHWVPEVPSSSSYDNQNWLHTLPNSPWRAKLPQLENTALNSAVELKPANPPICSVSQSCPTLCDPKDYSTPSFPVLHHLPQLAQTHVHWVGDAIQPSHSLLFSSPPAFYISQHPGPFQWVGSLHQVAKILELQLHHQSFQWIFRVDFL